MLSEKTYWLAFDQINDIGLGSRRIYKLYKHFASLKSAWYASELELKAVRQIPAQVIDKFIQVREKINLELIEKKLADNNVQAITYNDRLYPSQLTQLANPPLILYIKGKWNLNWFEKSIAIVGRRQASAYAQQHAYNISKLLTQAGFTIISGSAKGVDICAHQGSLSVNNQSASVAVVANGVDQIVPKDNKVVYEQLYKRGSIISEYPLGTKPLKGFFPARNRIIAALSQCTLVIEAAVNSGSLITAERALELNKPLFCLPGNINYSYNQGSHDLIREGKARLITSVNDILKELNCPVSLPTVLEEKSTDTPLKNDLDDLSQDEREIYVHLPEDGKPIGVDLLASKLQTPISKINSVLMKLRLKKLITHKNHKILRIIN